MTHSKFVSLAKAWLLSAKQCNPVFIERGSAKTNEIPDAIGWNSKGSIIVECKTSLSDFRADTKKPFRIDPKSGMGKFRYYLFPLKLYNRIPIEELPEGWGIGVVDVTRIYPVMSQVRCKNSKEWPFNIEAELYYMRSRVLQIQRYGR